MAKTDMIWFEFMKCSGINDLKLIFGSFLQVLPGDCWHSLVAEGRKKRIWEMIIYVSFCYSGV